MYEVEMKARISDPEAVLSLLRSKCRYLHPVRKSDEYFILRSSGFAFRIRKDTTGVYLTVKEKTWRGTVEVNREYETPLEDAAAVKKIAAAGGFEADFTKSKIGHSFDYDGIHVELIEVAPLGWFLEAELVLEDQSGSNNAVGRIKDFFREMSVPEESWEDRYYSELLRSRD